MTEVLNPIVSLPIPFNMIVLIVLIACVSGILTSAFKQLRKYGCHRQNSELKRDLVERGLAIEEIERIMAAGTGKSDDA